MTPDRGPDSNSPQDEVLSKVDALLRRHRSGGLDAALDASPEPEIPTLTELIDGSPTLQAPRAARRSAAHGDVIPTLEQAWLALLQPDRTRRGRDVSRPHAGDPEQ
jgi:hypothetical protein